MSLAEQIDQPLARQRRVRRINNCGLKRIPVGHWNLLVWSCFAAIDALSGHRLRAIVVSRRLQHLCCGGLWGIWWGWHPECNMHWHVIQAPWEVSIEFCH